MAALSLHEKSKESEKAELKLEYEIAYEKFFKCYKELSKLKKTGSSTPCFANISVELYKIGSFVSLGKESE